MIDLPTLHAFVDLFMVSDPWPLDDDAHTRIETFLDAESVRAGFVDWLDLYHTLPPTPTTLKLVKDPA